MSIHKLIRAGSGFGGDNFGSGTLAKRSGSLLQILSFRLVQSNLGRRVAISKIVLLILRKDPEP
jgi:hypothetical protein